MADSGKTQHELPFGEAEGMFAERKELLGLALLKTKADLHLAQLVLWVFNTTDGGMRGTLRKTYMELATAPWGLCCGRTKAAETVAKARRLGLLSVTENRDRCGDRDANDYVVSWEGIRDLLGRISIASDSVSESASRTTPSVIRTTPSVIRTTPSVIRTHYKEYTSSHSVETDCLKARMPSGSDPDEHRQRIADALAREEVWKIPELEAARFRHVAPLPAESLVRGPFDVLEEKHLTDVMTLARWFRRQLSLTYPAAGDSEAELILVIAAGLVVKEIPAAEVQKSRLAIFVSTVSRGLWRKVYRRVPEAALLLSKLTAHWPHCLSADDWPGPRADKVHPCTEETSNA